MDLPKAFGEVLRMYRKRAEMTQEQLGFEAGVERNYVSMLELGQRQWLAGSQQRGFDDALDQGGFHRCHASCVAASSPP